MARPFPAAPAVVPGSLLAALATVPDPRRPYGWNPAHPPLPLAVLLQLCVAAILCGSRSLYAIAQWGQERREDDPELLARLGLPRGQSPCVATLHRVFKALDVAAFERAVGDWLARTGVEPTDPVALDGKTLRGIHGADVEGVHLVAAYAHHAAVVLAQLTTPGKGQELAAAGQVLKQVPLEGRVVTGDALLTQRDLCEQIVGAGGDYLLPVKENQPALQAAIAAAFSPSARHPARSDAAADPADLAAAAVVGARRQPDHRRRRPGQSGARAL
jgi:DDE_Tnp_1-associated/Transposase DDE domain